MIFLVVIGHLVRNGNSTSFGINSHQIQVEESMNISTQQYAIVRIVPPSLGNRNHMRRFQGFVRPTTGYRASCTVLLDNRRSKPRLLRSHKAPAILTRAICPFYWPHFSFIVNCPVPRSVIFIILDLEGKRAKCNLFTFHQFFIAVVAVSETNGRWIP